MPPAEHAAEHAHAKHRSLAAIFRSKVGMVLAITVLVSLPFSATEGKKLLESGAGDFQVYLTAAHLVRDHQSVHIYDGADTGKDPQLRRAVPGTLFYQTAADHGVVNVALYVYPPTLADALLPLTLLSYEHARIAWWAGDVLALIASALLMLWLFNVRAISMAGAATVLAFLLFRTDMTAVYWGQVTVYLLLLWTAGIVLYAKGHLRSSAVLLALAAAIKLTPVLVLLPLLFWREWRWCRWFCGALAAFALAICAINGPATLADFAFRVVPPMSGGIPGILNCSIAGGTEMLWAALHGVDVKNIYFVPIAADAVKLGKGIALATLAAVFLLIARIPRPASVLQRAQIVGMVALLSVFTSPVAWRHAYTVCCPLLFLLWNEALEQGASNAWLAMLAFATLEFGFIVDTLLAKALHGAAFGAVPLLGPLTATIVIAHQLLSIKHSRTICNEAPAP